MFHGPTQREFPGRCANISAGGMLMYVPPTTPVQPGQSIRISIGAVDRPEFAPLSLRPVEATIVRVDRSSLLTQGNIAVGARFAEA